MDKATTYDDYMNFKVIELKVKCKELHIKPSKLKKDIINQILEHYKNLEPEPEPDCIIDEDSDELEELKKQLEFYKNKVIKIENKIKEYEKPKLKKELGQFFTTNKLLQDKVIEFILNKPDIILEPSIGKGHLIKNTLIKYPKIIFHMYEIDDSISFFEECKNVIIDDFLKLNIKFKYETIIGNPPYVKTTRGNLYIDFIEKCFNLLDIKGELIFIISSDFFKLTSAVKLINILLENGTFTHIFHPNLENLFDNASIDVIIFRYCKDKSLNNIVIYNNETKFLNNSNGMITFTGDKIKNKILLSSIFNVYVGLVSGCEDIYKNNDLFNFEVLNKKNIIDKYIFISKYPSKNKDINEYLLSKKDILIKRKIKKYNEDNWFEWGAPRNIKTMETFKNEPCIYISNLSRNDEVAFIGKVQYYGGSLLMLKPNQKGLDLKKYVNYLNSNEFKKDFTYSGRFKIGQRQLLNSFI